MSRHLRSRALERKEVASKVGLHPFVAGKYMDQSKRFSMRELRSVMEEGAQIEQNVKTGLLSDTLAVELFIVKYSSRAEDKRVSGEAPERNQRRRETRRDNWRKKSGSS